MTGLSDPLHGGLQVVDAAGSRLVLTSPLSGRALALDDVPDPVFAGRLLGDGIAVDPLGDWLHAPCDAHVTALHASHHAVTLSGEGGMEIMMHVGIDTVGLAGRGFNPVIKVGDRVERGEPLIGLDIDLLVHAAPSLCTPILLLNGDGYRIANRHEGGRVSVGELLLTVERVVPTLRIAAEPDGADRRTNVTVPLAHGIHARPAARIGEMARRFVAESRLIKDGAGASTRSAVALMALGIRYGDRIEVHATGEDAAEACEAVANLIAVGLCDADEGTAPLPTPAIAASALDIPAGALKGVTAVPGIALGRACWRRSEDAVLPEHGEGVEKERQRLHGALAHVRTTLRETGGLGAIAEAHLSLLDDPDLNEQAAAAISAGHDAAFAWRGACRGQAAHLRASGEPRIAERADDLLDIERRVIDVLVGADATPSSFPPDTILLADDLLPSHVAALDHNVIALATSRGGPTSHAAILAAARGLPTVVALGPGLNAVPDGRTIVLDADAGLLRGEPSAREQDAARQAAADAAARKVVARAAAGEAAYTRDGHLIEVFANIGSVEDATLAAQHGAEGCGLLRTEFLYLDRETPPAIDEQVDLYRRIADALGDRPVIVRLLDIGGDKPAPYLPMPTEENPALGVRGVRASLAHAWLLQDQLRAIVTAIPAARCRIMLPMVSGAEEIDAVRARLDTVCAELGIRDRIQLGIMIETPAAAVTAATLARKADFFSIGTNDLTQYALAMDRGNPALAPQVDGLHPAVLQLISATVRGAAAHGRPVGVCGGLASDMLAVPLLIGLGVDELSCTPRVVPGAKAALRGLALNACVAVAEQALALETSQAVRAMAAAFLEEAAT